MAGITTAMTTSFKVEILKAIHDFTASTGDTFKCALFKVGVAGTYGPATTQLQRHDRKHRRGCVRWWLYDRWQRADQRHTRSERHDCAM